MKSIAGTNIDGETTTWTVGELVGFKADMECYGRIEKIVGRELYLVDVDPSGNYGQHTAQVPMDRCWK